MRYFLLFPPAWILARLVRHPTCETTLQHVWDVAGKRNAHVITHSVWIRLKSKVSSVTRFVGLWVAGSHICRAPQCPLLERVRILLLPASPQWRPSHIPTMHFHGFTLLALLAGRHAVRPHTAGMAG